MADRLQEKAAGTARPEASAGFIDGGSDGSGDAAGDGPAAEANSFLPGRGGHLRGLREISVPATDLGPEWPIYAYGGATVQVDSAKAFKGARSLHMTAPVGGRKYADIIKQNPPAKALLPSRHFRRAMVWLTTTPETVHWNINQASGPLASDPNLIAKIQRGRPKRRAGAEL